jgi:hypothetical protein
VVIGEVTGRGTVAVVSGTIWWSVMMGGADRPVSEIAVTGGGAGAEVAAGGEMAGAGAGVGGVAHVLCEDHLYSPRSRSLHASCACSTECLK